MLRDFIGGVRDALVPASAIKKDLGSPTGAGGMALSLGTEGSFARGGRELLKRYDENPALKRVAAIVAQALASTPFYLKKKNGNKSWSQGLRSCGKAATRRKAARQAGEVYEHPFLDFLARGSPLISGPSSLTLSHLYRLIKGEFFWHLIGTGSKVPEFFMVLPPSWISALPKPGKDFYTASVHGVTKKLPTDEVLWCKDASLAAPYGRGSGIGDALADEIDTDEYASSLLRYTLANRGFSDLLISIKGVKPEQAELVEAKYNQRHRGFYNTGRALVIDSDNLEVKPLTHALSELRLLELRTFERQVVAETFGVPPELLGRTQNSPRAAILGAETVFARRVLVPRLEALRLDLQNKVLPLFDPKGQYLLEYESPVPEDYEYKLQVMQAAPTAFTLNEYRSLADLEPEPWGDERVVVPGTQDVATDSGSQDKAAKSVAKASQTPYETGVALSDAEIAQLTSQIDSSELAEKLSPAWRSKMEQIALDQWASLGFADGSLTLVNPMISTHLAEFGARWVTEIDATTKTRLANTLAAGAEAGESISQLAARVKRQMGDLQADGYRARLIARTEVNRSANLGREFSWKATDLPLKKKYISALVKETRKAHADLHGKTIDVDESWKYDGGLEPFVSDTINMPGNSTFAAHSCHCLCTAVAFDPEHGKELDIPYQSESHEALCKSFEDETDAWEAETIKVMTPFYRALEDRLLDTLNSL